MGRSTLPFDQRLARRVVAPLARAPLSPNMLTLAGMLLGVCAGVLFAQGDRGVANWAAVIFMVAVWMDHVDGEFARLTGQTSRFGHYFDHVGALVTYSAMFVGAGIGARHGVAGGWAVACGISAAFSVAAIFSIRLWMEERLGIESVRQSQRAGFEIEDTLYVVGPVTWLGGLHPFVVAAGFGAPIFLLWTLWDAARKSRQA